jgi:nucleotide-binding universal stress UspA family protein
VLVLTAALAEARLRGAPLHVRHCRELIEPSVFDGLSTMSWAALEAIDRSADVLAVSRQTLATLDESWPVTLDRPIGRPENLLVEAGELASLVVVGTGAKSRLEEIVLGTTALNVAAHATCPVLVVPPEVDPDGAGDIVVGIDGSRHSQAAAAVAAEEARLRQARLVVVTTWSVEVVDGYVVTEPGSPEWQQVETRIGTMQEHVLAEVDTAGLAVEPRVVKGGIRSSLAKASAGAAMVVVGNRGRGGFRSKALGSVTMDLLKRATCPVLVVHAER